MTYINSLTTIVQDRINHLESLYKEKEGIMNDYDRTSYLEEIDQLERVLDILVEEEA